jgi:two-component system, NarL family, invasion response regulator UvrY
MPKILIADSDPVFRKALALLIIRRLKIIHIDEAADTGTLLQKLAENRPDLLILNWSIHGVAGPAVCVLARNTYPELKVILLSPNPEDETEARSVGAIFMCKGASPEDTLKTLGSVLQTGEQE